MALVVTCDAIHCSAYGLCSGMCFTFASCASLCSMDRFNDVALLARLIMFLLDETELTLDEDNIQQLLRHAHGEAIFALAWEAITGQREVVLPPLDPLLVLPQTPIDFNNRELANLILCLLIVDEADDIRDNDVILFILLVAQGNHGAAHRLLVTLGHELEENF